MSNKITLLITIATLLLSALFGAFALPGMFPEILEQTLLRRIVLCLLFPLSVILGLLVIFKYPKWIKHIKKVNDRLARILYLLIFHPFARVAYLTGILFAIIVVSRFNYWVFILSVVAELIFIWSLKLFPFREYKKKDNKKVIIFEDDFTDNKGWFLNYWGTTNPAKTNRIENSMIIFEATEDDLLHPSKEFGAYIDLRNNIKEGEVYEVSCSVKAELGTTMKFQLWVHDNIVGNKLSMRTEKYPIKLKTPSARFKEVKLRFVATSTNGMRIHLHNKGGKGRIFVKKVIVLKA